MSYLLPGSRSPSADLIRRWHRWSFRLKRKNKRNVQNCACLSVSSGVSCAFWDRGCHDVFQRWRSYRKTHATILMTNISVFHLCRSLKMRRSALTCTRVYLYWKCCANIGIKKSVFEGQSIRQAEMLTLASFSPMFSIKNEKNMSLKVCVRLQSLSQFLFVLAKEMDLTWQTRPLFINMCHPGR